jgi:hypothetical protein
VFIIRLVLLVLTELARVILKEYFPYKFRYP